MKNMYFLKFLKYIIISILIALGLELIVFNFNSYVSLFYKKGKDVSINTVGVECSKNNNCIVDENSEENYIIFSNIDRKVYDFYLNIKTYTQDGYNFKIGVKYENNKKFIEFGKNYYDNNFESSKYMVLHTDGNVSALRVDVSGLYNFKILDFKVNPNIPINISFFRIIIAFLLTLIIFVFRPNSVFYDLKMDTRFKAAISSIIIVVLFLGAYSYYKFSNPGVLGNVYSTDLVYDSLADNLLKGHLYLNVDVSDELKEVSNPYDSNYVVDGLVKNKDYYPDLAYYNGHYYSNLGILPSILIYIPCHILHINADTGHIILLSFLIFMIASFMFMNRLISDNFKNVPLLLYIVFSIFLIMCGTSQIFYYPTAEIIPKLLGISFVLMGFSLYIKYIENKKIKYLTFGSIFISLAIACNYMFGITIFIIIPLLWGNYKNIFCKFKNEFAFLSPFIIVSILLMVYNYVRFGNIFESGISYTIGSGNLSIRTFSLRRTLTGLFYYLIAPLNYSGSFPYLVAKPIEIGFLGSVRSSYMSGGLACQNILVILTLFLPCFKSIFKNQKLYKMCLISNIISLIIIILDTNIVGINLINMMDFSFIFAITTVCIILVILSKWKSIVFRKLLLGAMLIMFIFTLLLNINPNEKYYSLNRFNYIKEIVEFWK